MYTLKVNQENSFEISQENNKWIVDGQEVTLDISQTGNLSFHVIKEHKSFQVDVIRHNSAEKTATLKVNGTKYEVKLEDRFDALLKSLGMDNLSKKKVNQVKAPMPGLVVKIAVEEGAEVKQGDALLVLEAMKMENILKSPTDGVVKKIVVKQGMPVEKNQILIEF
jgi:biotin carboxyl carrier protein